MLQIHGVPIAALVLLASALASCGAAAPAERSAAASDIEVFGLQLREAEMFSGGKWQRFESVGRNTLGTAISLGLNPDHVVLDIGAGSLRMGWWFLHFVEASNYHAVEPVRTRIDRAVEILGADIHVYYNEDWEFPEVEFDFVIARSIWTHTSKWMIAKMLSEFAEHAAPEGKFLTSVNLAEGEDDDYLGDDWVGKIEADDGGGMVKHSLAWIEEECAKNGLAVSVQGDLAHQTWLLIERE